MSTMWRYPIDSGQLVVSAGGFVRYRRSSGDDWSRQPELASLAFLSGPRGPQHVKGSTQGRTSIQILPLTATAIARQPAGRLISYDAIGCFDALAIRKTLQSSRRIAESPYR